MSKCVGGGFIVLLRFTWTRDMKCVNGVVKTI